MMKKLLAAMGMACICLSVVGCGAKDNTEVPSPLTQYSFSVHPKLIFQRSLTSGSGVGTALGLAQDAYRLIAVGHAGDVSAIDKRSGKLIWQVQLNQQISATASDNGQDVFVVTRPGRVIAMNALNGKILWHTQLQSTILASAGASATMVVVHEHNGDVVGLNAKNGQIVWTYNGTVPALQLQGNSAPLVKSDSAYVGFDNGQVYAFDVNTGSVKWSRPIAIADGNTEITRMVDVTANPVMGYYGLYAVSSHGNLVALNPLNGSLVWQHPMNAYNNIASNQKAIFVSDAKAHVIAVQASSGRTLWHQNALEARWLTGPMLLSQSVVVGDYAGYLHFINESTGVLQGRIKVGNSSIVGPGVVFDHTLYVITNNGRLSGSEAIMRPVIALVGRPNVGKSTLFNALTKTRNALVLDLPGTTRDRQYGEAMLEDTSCIVIDTGGLSGEEDGVEVHMSEQVMLAVEESNLIVFVVDARAGLTAHDREIAQFLRTQKKPIILVANKVDGVDAQMAVLDFYELGFGEPSPMAASHRKGINLLIEAVCENIPEQTQAPVDETLGAKVAIIGRPNVGKSTLTNRLLGDDRVVVYDMPGTTRDSIYVSLEHHGKPYTFIDTAGVRRKSRVDETIEKFSIVKTLNAIQDSHVALVIVDGSEALTEQDLHLIGFALHLGRGVVIAVNKWDHLSTDQREKVKNTIDRKLKFVEAFVDIHFISAKHGTNVGHLYQSVDEAYSSGQKKISTADVNRVLEAAIRDHAPPMKQGRRIKIKYAHVGGHNPLRIVLHGNQVDKLQDNYQRYLIQTYRKAFDLRGVPIHLELLKSNNPYG